MTQDISTGHPDAANQKRMRGPNKPFPSITFEEALVLPKSILEHGVDGQMQRLTLLRELEMSPSSSKTRNLIGGSHKYRLTDGSYTAQSLVVTEAGRQVLASNAAAFDVKRAGFELAIGQFGPFKTVYDKLKGNRLREGAVLQDELYSAGVSQADSEQAAQVFTDNLRFLGLVYAVTGQDYVRSLEDALDEIPTEVAGPEPHLSIEDPPEPAVHLMTTTETNGKVEDKPKRPALHIDIQVHIDPTSSAEQIDQIFASMAKHLYGLDS